MEERSVSHKGRRARWCALVAVAAAVVVSCDRQPRDLRDLEAIQRSGELRVVVRPGFAESPLRRTGAGDQAALIRRLADRLGVRVRWIRVRRHDHVLRSLLEGRADLAVSRFAPATIRSNPRLAASAAVTWVDDVAVEHVTDEASSPTIHGLDVWLPRSVARWALERPPEVWSPVRVHPVPEEVPLEEILERVRSGRYLGTVVDSALLQAWPGHRDLRATVADRPARPLVWLMRASSRQLEMAVNEFLFASQLLAPDRLTVACRDLEAIRQAGVLRLVTRNSPTTCTVARGGLGGFEYELALAFARRIGGVRLELSIPPPGVDPLDWLEQGYGDLAALHEPVAPDDAGRFLLSAGYRRVDLVSVLPASGEEVFRVEELAGRRAVASRQVAGLAGLMPLDPPLDVAVPRPGFDGLAALRLVELGQEELAVVDADTARLELPNRPSLRRGPTVVPSVRLVWVVNPSSPALFRAADGFLRSGRRSGLVRKLMLAELGSWRPYVPPELPQVPEDDLSPYDEVLRWAGRRHGIDWRLLASLMYEESRFDPYAVGPGGSAGLFQFMPFTWRELGVEDPHHPMEAIEAGARYLRRLMDSFSDLPLPDQVAMAIASFNVGPRHVFDARQLAGQMGLDPDRWSGSVETAMVLLDDPEVARRFPAGVCRCRRAVAYTRRILRRYQAYVEQFPPG